MKTVIKEVPIGFDDGVALSVVTSPDMRGPDQYQITATHPARPGVAIRKPFEAPRGAKFEDLANRDVWRHGLPLSWEHIVTALWVSDQEAYEVVETYEDTPVGIGEVRANKTRNAADWTPREALVELLRRVDGGEYPDMDALVLCFREKHKDGTIGSYYSAASPDIHTTLGVVARAEFSMQQGVNAQ